MTITIASVDIKIKNGQMTIYTGTLIKDKVCKIPLALIPKIKWAKDMEVAVIATLLEAKEYKTILAMEEAENPTKPTRKRTPKTTTTEA